MDFMAANEEKQAILEKVKKRIYTDMQSNAMSNNVEYLKKIIILYENNPDCNLSAQEISSTLAEVYEDFKVANVPISREVTAYAIDKLLNAHFINKNEIAAEIDKDGSKRINFVCKLGDELQDKYFGSEGKDIDEEFVLKVKFIAKNIHLLKKIKKFDLPWEQMEFLMVIFIVSVMKPEGDDIFICKLVLDKNRLLAYLNTFVKQLKAIQENQKGAKTKRGKETNNNNEFQELLKDYEIVKDVYSLKQILGCIQDVKSVNPALDEEGKLVLERALQIIGEYFKNTQDSPNLSDDVHRHLLASAPKDIKNIITKLRDCLSHTNTLINKMEIEAERDGELFDKVRNDLLKVEKKIEVLMNRKRISAIQVFLNKILCCDHRDQVSKLGHKLARNLGSINPNDLSTSELDNLQLLVDELSSMIQSFSCTEKELPMITKIKAIIKEHKLEIKSANYEYIRNTLSLNDVLNLQDLNNIKTVVELLLKSIGKILKPERLQLVASLLLENQNDILTGLDNRQSSKIIEQIYKIFFAVEFEIGRIKGIDGFKDELNSEYGPNESLKDQFLDRLHEFVKNDAKETHEKVVKLLNILEKRMEGNNNSDLESNFCKSLSDLISKPKQRDLLKSEFIKNNFSKCKELIQRLDKYGPLVKNLKITEHFSGCITLLEKASDIIDTSSAINLYRQLTKQYYSERLEKLKSLIYSTKHNLRAVEILVLELSELLENAGLFTDHKHFLEGHIPLLIGKALRNYLAHGNPLVDMLMNTSDAILTNARVLVLKGPELIETDKKIGEYYVIDSYKHYMETIKKQNEMLEAAKGGDLQRLIECVEGGANILGRNIDGKTIIDFAVEFNNQDILEFAINLGVSKDGLVSKVVAHGNISMLKHLILNSTSEELKIRDSYGKTLLHIAAENGHAEIVMMLLEINRTDVNAVTNGGWTPLHYAVNGSFLTATSELLKHGADVNGLTEDGYTSLHLAAQAGCTDIIDILFQYNAKVNAKGLQDDMCPLHFAVQNGHQSAVKILLEHGADVNVRTAKGLSPLYLAAQQGHESLVLTLLDDWNASIQRVTNLNESPLLIAAFMNHENIVDLLLARNIDVNDIGFSDKCSALHAAATHGLTSIIKKLLDKNADITAKDYRGFTALHIAARKGHLSTVQMLLECSNDHIIDLRDNDEFTALHLAAQNNHNDVIMVLVSEGANVNAENSKKVTPLHAAAENGHEEACEMLLALGAYVNAKTGDGKTALHFAAIYGYTKIIDVLHKYNADLMARTSCGYTAVHYAALCGHNSIIEKLVQMFVDVKSLTDNITPMHLASKQGHKVVVEELIKYGAVVDSKSRELDTPLIVAANFGHKDVVELLLDKKADANSRNVKGCTALHFAAFNGHDTIVKTLLTHKNGIQGENINLKDDAGFTALHMATQKNQKQIAKMLVTGGANVNVTAATENATPLHLAVANGNIEICEMLLANGANIMAKCSGEFSLIHVAAQKGYDNIVEILLEAWKTQNGDAQIAVNVQNIEGTAPIHEAVRCGHKNVVEVLLHYRADVNIKDIYGVTPLHMAAECGRRDIVCIFINNGANVNAENEEGMVPLHFAALKGCADVVVLLLEHNADINARNILDETALHLAVTYGHKHIVEMLLKADADVNARNKNGLTPLRHAIHKVTEMGNVSFDIISSLLRNGADPEAIDNDGETALYSAAVRGYKTVAALLAEHKANVNAKISGNGLTALHVAVQNGHRDVAYELLRHGADVNCKGAHDVTPLHYAAQNGDVELIDAFVRRGADVNVSNSFGLTPLHLAVVKKRCTVVEYLLELDGINVNSATQNGETPLYLAVKTRQKQIIRSLMAHGANIWVETSSGDTAMLLATKTGCNDIIEILLEIR